MRRRERRPATKLPSFAFVDALDDNFSPKVLHHGGKENEKRAEGSLSQRLEGVRDSPSLMILAN
jgi:hypothetical protein